MSHTTQSPRTKRLPTNVNDFDFSQQNEVQYAATEALAICAISSTAKRLLDEMAQDAKPGPDGQLICMTRAGELTKRIRVSRGHGPRLLRELESKGYVIDRTDATGARGYRNGRMCGIDVSPAIQQKEPCKKIRKAIRKDAKDNSARMNALSTVKSQVTKTLRRVGKVACDVWSMGIDFLASLPERFDIPDEELDRHILAGRAVLKLLTKAVEQLEDSARVTSMSHGCHQDESRNTDTNNNISISNTLDRCEEAVDKNPARSQHADEKKSADKNNDTVITINDALALMTENDKDLLRTCFELAQHTHDPNQKLMYAYEQVAIEKWRNLGGDMRTLEILTSNFNQLERGILLFIFADRVFNENLPPVLNLHGYVRRCVNKCLEGTFKWSAGIKSAARRVEAHT